MRFPLHFPSLRAIAGPSGDRSPAVRDVSRRWRPDSSDEGATL